MTNIEYSLIYVLKCSLLNIQSYKILTFLNAQAFILVQFWWSAITFGLQFLCKCKNKVNNSTRSCMHVKRMWNGLVPLFTLQHTVYSSLLHSQPIHMTITLSHIVILTLFLLIVQN